MTSSSLNIIEVRMHATVEQFRIVLEDYCDFDKTLFQMSIIST